MIQELKKEDFREMTAIENNFSETSDFESNTEFSDNDSLCSLNEIIPVKQHFGYALGIKTLNKNRKVYVISFRGTADIYTWFFTDFLIFPVNFLATNTKVHVGFEWYRQACMDRYKLINFIEQIRTDKNDPKVLITGHSLGAAVAVLQAAYFIEENIIPPEKMHLITLAEPCPGQKDFTKRYQNRIKNYKWFCNRLDLVPIAPVILGYNHFGSLSSFDFFNIDPDEDSHVKKLTQRHSLNCYLKHIENDTKNSFIMNIYKKLIFSIACKQNYLFKFL